MKNTIVMILRQHHATGSFEDCDIEVPVHITANDLVIALNTGFRLGIDTENVLDAYLRTENPIALIKGEKTITELGLYDGTIIHVTR